MPRHALPALALLVLLSIGVAHAGTVVESVSSANGPQTLTVAGDRVRIDPARTGAPGMLFDAARGRLVLLNRPASQYNRIEVDRLDALEARVREQRESMLRKIEGADEDEKKRLRRRLDRLPEVDAAASIRIETSGEMTTVSGIECERASALEDGERTHRLCIGRVSTLGLTETAANTLRQLFEFLARMRNLLGSGSAPFDARLLQATLEQADAFPVRIERIDDGATWTVRSIETAAIPAERFEIPADFTEGARLGGE
ncbi:MAG: DUF4412 domain-containing protein [Halofilum sp. (in: g-proteobacteria)]|nr:DUF4412 domain-containing protein [Halofilum sp. (in: g-proteobacteria)]